MVEEPLKDILIVSSIFLGMILMALSGLIYSLFYTDIIEWYLNQPVYMKMFNTGVALLITGLLLTPFLEEDDV